MDSSIVSCLYSVICLFRPIAYHAIVRPLTLLVSVLIPYAYGYKVLLGYQLDETNSAPVPSSYTVASSGSDPQTTFADILLYHLSTASWTPLSNAISVVRNEAWNRSLTNVSYPYPGLYTVRLVESSCVVLESMP